MHDVFGAVIGWRWKTAIQITRVSLDLRDDLLFVRSPRGRSHAPRKQLYVSNYTKSLPRSSLRKMNRFMRYNRCAYRVTR